MTTKNLIKSSVVCLNLLFASVAWSSEQRLRAFDPPNSYVWLDQGWTAEERSYWHHISGGQAFAPLSWLKALELADSPKKLMNKEYLQSIGFLFDNPSKENPYDLPIGFAVAKDNPMVNGMVGFTCATCHTTQLKYKNKAIRIDGGVSMLDLVTFFKIYRSSLAKAYSDPDKWVRFSASVRKDQGQSDQELRNKVREALDAGGWASKELAEIAKASIASGPSRLDALNGIGNLVFGSSIKEGSNFHALSAPASIPYLWDIWRFDWMHYNSSFSQPMAQNVLQVLGANGWTNFIDANGSPNPSPVKWDSSVDIKALESTDAAFKKLKAPEWPSELFGSYDVSSAAKGEKLFASQCSSCHGPKLNKSTTGQLSQLSVVNIPLEVIGTDPAYAQKFATQTFDVSKLSGDIKRVSGAQALAYVTEMVKNRAYDKLSYTEKQRAIVSGSGRENIMRGDLVYRARTLNGVWSSAPYLHNGSVPNIYELLSPVAERSSKFWLGSYDYDPKKLGFVNAKVTGGFLFDTSIAGNGNKGHEFTDKKGPGVLGRLLSPEERLDIIEYLKSMKQLSNTLQ
jgi:cytochrome c5